MIDRKELKARGYKMAIVSNKPMGAVQELTKAYFGDYIDVAIGVTDALRRKPYPDQCLKAMNDLGSTPHDFTGFYGSSTVLLKTSPEGTGIIAGGPARIVLELAGYKNIRTKSLGSNNKQNVVLATVNGLSQLKTPEQVAALRGISVEQLG